jgi:hypothetical protein
MFKQGLNTQRMAAQAIQAKRAKADEEFQDIMKDLKIDYSKYKPYQFGDIRAEFATVINDITKDYQKNGRVTADLSNRIQDFKGYLGLKAQRSMQLDSYLEQADDKFDKNKEFERDIMDSTQSASTIFAKQYNGVDFTQDGDLVAATGVPKYDSWLGEVVKTIKQDQLNTKTGDRVLMQQDGKTVREILLGLDPKEKERMAQMGMDAINSDSSLAISTANRYNVKIDPSKGKGPVGGFLDLFPPEVRDRIKSDMIAEFSRSSRSVTGQFSVDDGTGSAWSGMSGGGFSLVKSAISVDGIGVNPGQGVQNGYAIQADGKTIPTKQLTIPAGSIQLGVGGEGDITVSARTKGQQDVQGSPVAMFTDSSGKKFYKIATKSGSEDYIRALVAGSIDKDNLNNALIRSAIANTYVVPATEELDNLVMLAFKASPADFKALWDDIKWGGGGGAPASISNNPQSQGAPAPWAPGASVIQPQAGAAPAGGRAR